MDGILETPLEANAVTALEMVTDHTQKKKTESHSGNPLTKAARTLGTRLGHLVVEASELAAAGQEAALVPSVKAKKPTKKATAPKRLLAKKTGSEKGPSKTRLKRSRTS